MTDFSKGDFVYHKATGIVGSVSSYQERMVYVEWQDGEGIIQCRCFKESELDLLKKTTKPMPEEWARSAG